MNSRGRWHVQFDTWRLLERTAAPLGDEGRDCVSRPPTRRGRRGRPDTGSGRRRGRRQGLLLPGIGKVDSQQAVPHRVVLVSIQEHDAFSFEQSARVPAHAGGLLQDG